MIYTVGKAAIYDPLLGRPDFMKAAGGSVWRTYNEALKFCSDGFRVYGVLARWGVDTKTNASGKWGDLLIDAPIVEVTHGSGQV